MKADLRSIAIPGNAAAMSSHASMAPSCSATSRRGLFLTVGYELLKKGAGAVLLGATREAI